MDTGEFRVIDRAQRSNLLREIEFSLSDCTDEACQLELGRLLSADLLVVGSLGTIGSKYVVNAKLIDLETGQTLRSESRIYGDLDALVGDAAALMQGLLDLSPDLASADGGEVPPERIALLPRKYAQLTIRSTCEGASVLLDGELVGSIRDGQFTEYVEKGSRVDLLVTRARHFSFGESIQVGDDVTVPIELQRIHWIGLDAAGVVSLLNTDLAMQRFDIAIGVTTYFVPSWLLVRYTAMLRPASRLVSGLVAGSAVDAWDWLAAFGAQVETYVWPGRGSRVRSFVGAAVQAQVGGRDGLYFGGFAGAELGLVGGLRLAVEMCPLYNVAGGVPPRFYLQVRSHVTYLL